MRLKHRYFLCECLFGDSCEQAPPITTQDLYNSVKLAVKTMHGDYGIAAVSQGLNVKYLNPYTSITLIRVRSSYQKILASSLPFITVIGPYYGSIRTLHLSGTIRASQKFLVKYNRQQLVILLKQCKTKEEKRKVRASLQQCTLRDKAVEFHGGQ